MKMDVIGYVLWGGVVVCLFGTLFVLEEESIPGVWAILLAIITLILGGLLFLRLRKGSEQRTKEFKRISEQLGMTFSAMVKGRAKDQATPPVPLFYEGHSRVVTNMLHGDSELLGFAEEFEVRIFAYGFTRQQQDQHVIMQSVICFQSPQLNLPKFQLRPEHFSDKIVSKLGYQDIDFESHPTAVEFSKKYLLRGKDEQKIRALFTDEVLALFAGQDKICVEGFSSHLCFYRARKLIEPEDIPAFMKEGFEVFRLFT